MSENTFSLDVEAIPEALAERTQWICWRAEDRDGKTTKIPVDPATGGFASTTDDRTWAKFEQALECAATDVADGIGFVFTATDPLVGIDLDDCRDPETGRPLEPAVTIIKQLESFTEVSPSGTGYHVIVEGELPRGRNRRGPIEMYEESRFFTVTAEHVDGTPTSIERRQAALEEVHEQFVAEEEDTVEDAGAEAESSEIPSRSNPVLDLEDEELLEKARSASNGEKFDGLWRGSIAGYASQSEADMALCCLLAFWTGRDATRMDQLFRRSGLMRAKWDDVHHADGSTYGEKTIERAIATTDDVYDPTRGHSNGDRDEQPDDATAEGVATTRVAYLTEKNRLLSDRISELEELLEQKAKHVEELEADNRTLRNRLATYEEQLESADQESDLESDAGATSSEGRGSIWNRARRFVGEEKE